MLARAPGEQLLGPQRERDVLDRALKAARDGQSGLRTIYGEAEFAAVRVSRPPALSLEGR